MIYKFQPFSVTKELGKEYNAHCELVPCGDWILITDWDVLLLSRGSFRIMEQCIAKYPQFEIFTAVTNRIGYRDQRKDRLLHLDPTDKITTHEKIAADLESAFGTSVRPITTAAGFFLLFSRKYWQEVGGFQERIRAENSRLFDYNFCKLAQERKTIGLMEGVYVWHTYRLSHERWITTKHLE